MLCYQIPHFGLASLTLAEHPTPEPAPGEVCVRLHAASINYRDWLMIEGRYNPKQKLPLIPCSDGAGEVIACGPGVTRLRTGDRVAGCFFPRWISGPPAKEKINTPLGGPLDGMLCQYRSLPEDAWVPIPSHLTYEEAATLPCAGVTAWSAIVEQGNVRPGETVLVQGTGGVSIFALQWAKLGGARVIITSSSDDKLARAKTLGADATINYRTTPDWDQAARALTNGTGVDHVVEVGGAGTIARSLRAVKVGGTISIIGVLGGNATETSLIPILMQNLRVQGVVVGSREMFVRMNNAITQHQIRPMLDRVFPFAQAIPAFQHLAARAHFGKISITIEN
ncbi:MAG: NAD(P)-dependent alcohol dehydrogenase [Acidobacteria bacterium]|nr:NAD(P)-dependent alcohol dehydrogenase [Acidobacteriota bacterium]